MGQKFFFEGSEKKVEMTLRDVNLHELSDDFWQRCVHACEAKILSKIENSHIKAYLLSESSLFIWRDRLVLITCGNTTLVNSLAFLVNQFSKEQIISVIFQRKNELQGRLQKSSFNDDYLLIQGLLNKGEAYRFGRLDAHHTFLFDYENQFTLKDSDKTFELLFYHLTGEASSLLNSPHQSKDLIREILGVQLLGTDFQIDDHAFSPLGYSLNAICGDHYLTIHVTPEKDWSYVSLEASCCLFSKYTQFTSSLIDKLRPKSIDFISFNDDQLGPFQDFISIQKYQQVTASGHKVRFTQLARPEYEYQPPHLLDE